MLKKTTKVSKKQKITKAKKTGISVPVLGIDGKKAGMEDLPETLFGAKINKPLMAQAVRAYLANQRGGHASVKTRGEVEGSTRKIYRQKGTGRARHGGIRAPIFVGGGIAFGPKPRDYHLDLPKKMKYAALASALTLAFSEGKVFVVSGLGGIAKTKIMAQTMQSIGVSGSTLLVTAKDSRGVIRVARNIASVDTTPESNLHAYTVLSHERIVFMKEAL